MVIEDIFLKSYSYSNTLIETILNHSKKPPSKQLINHIEILLAGSRMSAKTMNSLKLAIILAMLDVNIKINIWRHTVQGAQDTYDELLGVAQDIFFIKLNRKNSNVSKRTLTLNGNKITVYGYLSNRKSQSPKLGKARLGVNKDIEVNFLEESTEFGKEQDIQMIKQAMGGGSLTVDIYAANPWVLSNWYIKKVNDFLKFDEKQLREKGEQTKVVIDKENKKLKIAHITNHRVNTYLSEYQHKMLTDLHDIDANLARVADLGMPGTLSGQIYNNMDRLIRVKDYQQLNSYLQKNNLSMSNFSGGIDLGVKDHANTFQMVARLSNGGDLHIKEWYHKEEDQGYMTNYDKANTIIDIILQEAKTFPILRSGFTIHCENDYSFIEIFQSKILERNINWIDIVPVGGKFVELTRINIRKYKMNTKRMVVVEDNVPNLISEMELQQWSDTVTYSKTGHYKPEDKDNHTTDACDYAITERMFEVTDEDQYQLLNKRR